MSLILQAHFPNICHFRLSFPVTCDAAYIFLARPQKPSLNSPIMFGALNRFISRLDVDTASQGANQGPGDNSFGFQVLRNTKPELPIEPWFDFIIGINSHYIVSEELEN